MSEDLISVIQASEHLGKRKQTVFKVLKRLGIRTQKQRHSSHKNQLIAYITKGEFQMVQEDLAASPSSPSESNQSPNLNSEELGCFYLMQLEPNHDPSRFKVGFTSSIPERLRALKCSAPFVAILGTWPCKRSWEKTVIECVSFECERLHTEVFRSNSIEDVRRKCQSFFDLMPKLR